MLTTENEIKVGDIVELKSGGPRMTVFGFEDEKIINEIQKTNRDPLKLCEKSIRNHLL